MTNPTAEFQKKLHLLAVSYAEKLPNKISVIEEKWQQLQNAWCLEELEVLHRMVHSLTGSGKTFGFAELSVKARILEQNLKHIAQLNGLNSEAQRLEINNQVLALRQASEESIQSQKTADLPSVFNTMALNLNLSAVKKIFVVDDDEEAAQELILQLGYFGYDVSYFCQIEPFKLALTNHPEAVILMTIEFQDENIGGIKVMKMLKDTFAKPPRVIFISSKDNLASRLGAVRAGSLAYFVKPINSAELIDVLDTLTSTLPQEPFRVLVVDDSATLLSYHSAILEQAGMTVRAILQPMEAMNALLELDPDLILMDLYMPECSGVELAKIIRQLGTFVSTPIVYLSSEDDFNTQLEAMSLGGDDFLVKPIEPKQLITAVTSRIQRARLLRSFMVRDSLTGLLNHTAIKEQLDREISRANRSKLKLSFAMVDIDFFKKVNDTYGHPTGDRVIKSLARLLKQRLRTTDIVGRYGGEEFAVIMMDTDALSAAKVLDDIRKVFERLFHLSDDKEFSVSFSCGVADIAHCQGVVDLGNAADKALYLAKHGGRNQVMQYRED